MEVRFWGTRGSLPTPGPQTVRFGGNTVCVEVRTGAGHVFIFDCGTGARPLGDALTAQAPVSASILFSHTHWDHIQGFPFFTPAFDPRNTIALYGPQGGRSLHETLARQMELSYFPVALNQLPATLSYTDLGEGAHTVGGARIVAQYLNHPAVTLGYRVEADGAEIERHARAVAERRHAPLEVFCAFEGARVLLDAPGGAPAAGPAAGPAPPAAIASGARVLIVDDDPVMRRLTRGAIENDGYVLTEAANGREALERIKRETPDLVILDFVMPELDGLGVLRVLRADPATVTLPVLLVTSQADEDSTRAGFEVGATDYLTKPFSSPQLSARVRACLARASRP